MGSIRDQSFSSPSVRTSTLSFIVDAGHVFAMDDGASLHSSIMQTCASPEGEDRRDPCSTSMDVKPIFTLYEEIFKTDEGSQVLLQDNYTVQYTIRRPSLAPRRFQ
jgi:hypothetical protein